MLGFFRASRVRSALTVALIAFGLVGTASLSGTGKSLAAAARSDDHPSATAAHPGPAPLSFELNRGQADGRVRFLAHTPGAAVWLTQNGAVMTLPSLQGRRASPQTQTTFGLKVVGANLHAAILGVDRLPGIANYFAGNDPRRWYTHIPTFGSVVYRNIYHGIDLIFGSNQGRLEYSFVVHPGADPNVIRLQLTGVHGSRLDSHGNLVAQVGRSEIVQSKPRLYQQAGGARPIAGRYQLTKPNGVRFAVGAYDRSKTLIIDPSVQPETTTVTYSTYLGGSGNDYGYAVATDASGNTYVAGSEASNNFPGGTPNGTSTNIFVSKFSSNGSTLVYTSIIGKAGTDIGYGIAVDSSGDAYVTGKSNSTTYPLVDPIQATNGGGYDTVVTKLDPTGATILYSTYLGGASDDAGQGIAVDSSGNAFIAGWSNSTNFPVANALYPTIKGLGCSNNGTPIPCTDAVVSELSFDAATSTLSLVYSSYLGGTYADAAYAVAVDSTDNAYVTGYTFSSDFPTQNPFQASNGGGTDFYGNAFVTKVAFNTATNTMSLAYSTYLGGSKFVGSGDYGYGIGVDSSGDATVAGDAGSTNFPVKNAFQATSKGSDDVFVSRLTSAGNALVYSTYLGGSNYDYATAVAVSSSGVAYVTGDVWSTNFPLKNPLISTNKGLDDPFISILPATGLTLTYSTYFGGSSNDHGNGIAIDSGGTMYVAGQTKSTNFPAFNGYQKTNGGLYDAWVAKLHN